MAEVPTISRDQILAALATAPDEPVAQACVPALGADPSTHFKAPTANALEFRSTMAKKFANARASGERILRGADEFLAALEAWGDRDFVGVYASDEEGLYQVVLDPETLTYLGAYTIHKTD